jgi:hypothetical protein
MDAHIHENVMYAEPPHHVSLQIGTREKGREKKRKEEKGEKIRKLKRGTKGHFI